MKERPILFSGPMVRAILEGRKTMTRRGNGLNEINSEPDFYDFFNIKPDGRFVFSHAVDGELIKVKCPYGGPGDRLWVRETFTHRADDDGRVTNSIAYAADGEEIRAVDGDGFQKYRKDGSEASCWIPSIFMPRWASRIELEITGVRVERLNEISEQDAVKEGLKPVIREKAFTVVCRGGQTFEVSSLCRGGVPVVGENSVFGEVTHIEPIPEKVILTAREAFKTLWGNINGRESWAKNPWVWVVEFVRVES